MSEPRRKKPAKGIPKRAGNAARRERRRRYFLRHGKAYTGK